MTARCIARGNTKKAWLFFGIMMAAAALALLLEKLHISKPLISQIVLLASLVYGVYILVRHVTAAYLYEITEEENEGAAERYLYIIRLQGKRGITQAKLPLSALSAIARVNPEGYRASVLNFSPVLLAEDDTFLAFSPETEKSLVRIHADEAFRAALFFAAPEAKDTLEAPEKESVPQRPRGIYDFSDIEQALSHAEKDTDEEKNDTEK